METKIIAAEIATAAGVTTIISSSKHPENIVGIMEYHSSLKTHEIETPADSAPPSRSTSPVPRPLHTVFTPSPIPMRDLKSWTSHTLFPSGSVVIDIGAHHVLSRRQSGGRLLAAGVLGVIGAFASGQAVRIVTPKNSQAYDADLALNSLGSTRPPTPSLIAASSLSSSVASLEPLSRTQSSTALFKQARSKQSQFEETDVIEVGRGLANYNSAQITTIKGLNR